MDAHKVAERLEQEGWVLHDEHWPPRLKKGRRTLHWPFLPYERLGKHALERILRHTDIDVVDLRA